MKLLIDNGADVNQALVDGRTALDFARDNGHNAVVELLQQSR